MPDLYRPPAPVPLSPIRALARSLATGERDLLSLLPDKAYRLSIGSLGYSRRGILFVNEPEAVRQILGADMDRYPKNDLFVGALAPLVGNGVFVSTGAAWRRQRRMIEPAFSHMQVGRAFPHMTAAVADHLDRLDCAARDGTPVQLDAAMSHLTADVVCRTLFSRTLENSAASEIFSDFETFQRTVANVTVLRLLFGRPFARVPQPADAVAACARIRRHLKSWLEPRLSANAVRIADTVGDIVAAEDPETGARFTLEELIDQTGVLFLAGHETTASTVTWALFILSQVPEIRDRVVAEIEETHPDDVPMFETTKRLPLLRAVLRETLRLYPPGPFLPRVALEPSRIGGHSLPRGGMAMISPWLIHRHPSLWPNADRFDPTRFLPSEGKPDPQPGAYLPFGLGPRTCIGAAFATVEGTLILATLLRRYTMTPLDPGSVKPMARLTIRPAGPVMVTLARR